MDSCISWFCNKVNPNDAKNYKILEMKSKVRALLRADLSGSYALE